MKLVKKTTTVKSGAIVQLYAGEGCAYTGGGNGHGCPCGVWC